MADILVGGTPSASSYLLESNIPSKGCDNDLDTYWRSLYEVPAWWQYDLGEGVSKRVRKLRICRHEDIPDCIKDFTLKGSNNGTDWTDLYTGIMQYISGWQEFLFENDINYRYYRIYISTGYYGTDTLGFAETEMMENPLQKTILSDAKIFAANIQENIVSDAKIKVVDIQESLTSDAYIVDRYQENILSNAKIYAEDIQKNISSNANIVALINLSTETNFVTKILQSQVVQTILDVILHMVDDIFDTNLTTRLKMNTTVDTNLATRLVSYESIPPKSLNNIVVKKDGSELLDVDYSSLKIQFNLNSTPSNATFVLARRHDDLDHNLLGASSIITAQNKIQIYDGTILLFTGYISKINALSSTDTVEVIAEDKRAKIKEITVSMYYGGYTPAQIEEEGIGTVYYSIQDAVQHVMGVAGLSGGGIAISLIPEPTYVSDSCTSVLDTLIGSSANINWYIDANENFQIQKVAVGSVKTLPLSSLDKQRGIYETILNDVILNKITTNTNNYAPSLYVKLGKHFITSWVNWTQLWRNYYLGWNKFTNEYYTEEAQKLITEDLNRLRVSLDNHQEPQIFVIQDDLYTGNTVNLDNYFVHIGFFTELPLVSAKFITQYKWMDTAIDIDPVVIGSGSPQKILDLTRYGKKSTNFEYIINDGWLSLKYDETYDYTDYALDFARFSLSQNNKSATDASVTLLLDAYEYYGINLSDLINLSNTISPNIYNNNNGFPLNISGVSIDCSTRVVTLNLTNYGKSFYQRSGNYMYGYNPAHIYGIYREYRGE